jgi:hypothetical protein
MSLSVMAGLLALPFLLSKSDLVHVPASSDEQETASAQQRPKASESEPDDAWTKTEIARGREQCMQVLKSVDADLKLLPPVKQGGCGAPALVSLKRLGSKSPVVFDPPVKVNCQVAAALYRWNKSTLQPAAKRALRSGVARILGASGYACRNVYNLPNRNLSQHAFANAIDVSAFQLRNGRIITVRKGWGPTRRDKRRQAEKIAAAARARLRKVSNAQQSASRKLTSPSGQKVTKTSLTLKDGAAAKSKPPKTTPQKNKPESPAQRAKRLATAKFLKRLHKGACGQFETVLGPEADDVHRSHFHFDLNTDRNRPYCG